MPILRHIPQISSFIVVYHFTSYMVSFKSMDTKIRYLAKLTKLKKKYLLRKNK